ncbi:alpha/beta hydrolase [Rurimicrobium arvi]
MRYLLLFLAGFMLAQSAEAQKEPLNYALSFPRFKQFYNERKSDSLYGMFAVTVKAVLSPEKTQDLINSLQEQYGTIGQTSVNKSAPQGLVYEAAFSKGKSMNVTYILNDKNEIAGLFFSPKDDVPAEPVVNNFEVTGSKGVPIKGTLETPASGGPHPLVIIVAGSGPTDRNGNSTLGVHSNTYKLLAECLLARGIASVRYDKCGIGASASPQVSEQQMRFETMSGDLEAIIRKARADKRFGKIYLAGHSEGSLVSMLAAQKEKVDGFISIAGPARPAGDILLEQISNAQPELAEETRATLESIKAGKPANPQNPALQQMFSPGVQPYVQSWMAYDPRVEIKKLSIPVLIIQGTEDTQVPVSEATMLHQARAGSQLTVLYGMTHTLKTATADPASNRKTYEDPAIPLTNGLCDAIGSFCK